MADLGMHLVVGGVFRLDRQECAGADMKRDEVAPDTAFIEGGEQRMREMQPGGGSRDRSLVAGEYRLVVGAVALVVGRFEAI